MPALITVDNVLAILLILAGALFVLVAFFSNSFKQEKEATPQPEDIFWVPETVSPAVGSGPMPEGLALVAPQPDVPGVDKTDTDQVFVKTHRVVKKTVFEYQGMTKFLKAMVGLAGLLMIFAGVRQFWKDPSALKEAASAVKADADKPEKKDGTAHAYLTPIMAKVEAQVKEARYLGDLMKEFIPGVAEHYDFRKVGETRILTFAAREIDKKEFKETVDREFPADRYTDVELTAVQVQIHLLTGEGNIHLFVKAKDKTKGGEAKKFKTPASSSLHNEELTVFLASLNTSMRGQLGDKMPDREKGRLKPEGTIEID